jgi:hypothetical protein
MRISLILLSIIFSVIVGCTPKNEEITEEYLDIESIDEAPDSVLNSRKDGARIEKETLVPALPLPQSILVLLTQRYPGWEEAIYTESVIKYAAEHKLEPGIIKGDFNGDMVQDYIFQLFYEEDIIILAALAKNDGNWQLYEIKREIAFNDRGTFKSPFSLHATDKGIKLRDPETGKIIIPTYQAVVTNMLDQQKNYLYQNDTFKAYDKAE